MEIKNLKTFVKVAELNNFTRAADAVGYSQATVSAQIKELEDELGKPLFDRLGKKIQLTEEGKVFLPHAMDILQAEELALDSVREGDKPRGRLSVITGSSLAANKLADVAQRFIEDFPDVELTIKIADYEKVILDKLMQGEVDFALCLDRSYENSDYAVDFIKEEKICFITYPENPILNKKSVKLKDILSDKLLLADRDIGYSKELEQILVQRGMPLTPKLELGSVTGILRIVRNGYGTTFIPHFMAKEDVDAGRLAVIEVDSGIRTFIQLIHNPNKWMNPQMRAFANYISKYL